MSEALAIRPSRDLRNHYAEISELCRKSPVAITVNGREDVVVISHQQYMEQQNYISALKDRLSAYERLARSQDDIRLGRVQEADEAFSDILAELDQYQPFNNKN